MSFEPNLVGFLCNWCSYTGADLAGTARVKYPPNLKVIRVMCSGRVDPDFILDALARGADGVLVCGCHPGECHYVEGNYKCQRRLPITRMLVGEMGIDPRRVRLEWVSASEGARFGEVEMDGAYAVIDEEVCSGCRMCNDLCPYSAIGFDEIKKISSVNPALCKACGTCAAGCPSGAVRALHFADEQIYAEIEGILS